MQIQFFILSTGDIFLLLTFDGNLLGRYHFDLSLILITYWEKNSNRIGCWKGYQINSTTKCKRKAKKKSFI